MDAFKFAEQSGGDIVERNGSGIRQFADRNFQELACGVGMKINSNHSEPARGSQQKRSGDLPDEEALRLELPTPFRQRFVRMGQVQDKLCAAIWNNALWVR
jgi:hypothetical protein